MRWSVEIIHSGAITLIRKRADRHLVLYGSCLAAILRVSYSRPITDDGRLFAWRFDVLVAVRLRRRDVVGTPPRVADLSRICLRTT